jgi:hypothetical protein
VGYIKSKQTERKLNKMKKIIIIVLSLVMITSLLSGCVYVKPLNLVVGKGDPVVHSYTVGAYDKIRIEGFADVRYYASPSDVVTLEIQPNLLEYCVVEVVGSELIFRMTENNINTNITPVLTVSTPVLKSMAFSGAGYFTAYDKITSDSFSLSVSGAGGGRAELCVKDLSVSVSGAGGFELSGSADTADIIMSGTGAVHALSLETRETNVIMSGVGTVKVNCSESLKIDGSGAGAVEYKGSPSVDIEKSGLVSVRKANS